MSAILKIKLPDIQGQPVTTLTAAAALGTTSLSVTNSGGLTASKYILIGGWKSPVAEIKLGGAISSAIAIATAATSFAHVAGETVQQIPYNQVEITYSENFEALWDSGVYATIADAAAAATWATLSSGTALVPSQEFTTVKDDSTTSRVYRWRYKNSTDTIYSDYINYQFPNGFERKSVEAIFRKSTNNLNKEISPTNGQVTYELLYDLLNEGLEEQWSERRRWSHDASFNAPVGDITAGIQSYIIPTGIERRNSDTPIWNLRINDGTNLPYVDKQTWDKRTSQTHHSQLAAQLTSASSTATFDDTSNFADDGTFVLWVSGVEMTITYTANNRTTNVLTTPDCATEVTATAAVDTDVWQNASFGTPTCYTVFGGKIYFDVVPGESVHARTITGDCYLACQQVDSLDDYVRTDNVNSLINFVRNGVMLKTNNTELAGYFDSRFANGMEKQKRTESTGQRKYLIPRSWPRR